MNVPKERLLQALKRVLVFLARVMIRAGIDCRQFVEVAKLSFVEVASEEYGIRGRKTNIARVAVMTGLTRKEVKRLRVNLESGDDLADLPLSISERMLHAWHTDSDFQTLAGKPKVLDLYDEHSGFTGLVKKHAGDIPVGALKTELIRTGLAEITTNDKFKVCRQDPFPKKQSSSIQTLLKDLARAGKGIEAKTFRGSDWPFSCVQSNRLREDDQDRMLAVLKAKMLEHSDRFDGIFSSYDMIFDDESKRHISLGVMQICFDEAIDDDPTGQQ